MKTLKTGRKSLKTERKFHADAVEMRLKWYACGGKWSKIASLGTM
jgi:hypothetical protein